MSDGCSATLTTIRRHLHMKHVRANFDHNGLQEDIRTHLMIGMADNESGADRRIRLITIPLTSPSFQQ